MANFTKTNMTYRNLDTQGIGELGVSIAKKIILKSTHLLLEVDGSIDKAIDGYIRLRKNVKFKKNGKNYQDNVETGNLIGIQVKTVSKIPGTGSHSYYINMSDKTKFGVNFNSKENLEKKKKIWDNFIGPVILIFVDLESEKCWWADLGDQTSYLTNDYSVTINKDNLFTIEAFDKISKLGRELFAKTDLINIDAKNYNFLSLSLTDFKKSAKNVYENLNGKGEFYSETINPTLGQILYTNSGWKHITRLNRRKMRIFNSIMLLGISKLVCQKVTNFTKVKKGLVRESQRYIKKVDFLTLRANVTFNFRQDAIVQVVIRRVKTFDKINPSLNIEDKYYFHSVYEPYRKE